MHLLELARPRARGPAGLDQRGLRRSRRAPAARDLLGQRQPDRPARLLRRGQARGRDVVLRLPRAPAACGSRSPASSTPTGRACTRTTAASSPTSSPRRCAASRSRSTATAARRAPSATSTTWSSALLRTAGIGDGVAGPSTSATPTSCRCWSVAQRVLDVTGSAAPESASCRCRSTTRVDAGPPSSAARALLGWRPRVGLDEGLRSTIEDFRRRLDRPTPALVRLPARPTAPAAKDRAPVMRRAL